MEEKEEKIRCLVYTGNWFELLTEWSKAKKKENIEDDDDR